MCAGLRFGAFFGNFVALFVPKRCQDDLEEVFFSIRFLHRFLVVFCSDLVVILGGFWEAFGRLLGSKSGFFWDFLEHFWSMSYAHARARERTCV